MVCRLRQIGVRCAVACCSPCQGSADVDRPLLCYGLGGSLWLSGQLKNRGLLTLTKERCGLSYCRRMRRTVDMILGLTAEVATALLLGLIARDDVGMSADMIRIDALSVAGIVFAAVASGSLLRREAKHPAWRSGVFRHLQGTCIRMCFTRWGDFVSARRQVRARRPFGPSTEIF